MTEEELKQKIEQRWESVGKQRKGGRIFSGFFILIIGCLLLARASGIAFPSWFFSAPVFLIAIGLFIGIRHRFRSGVWLIPIIVGSALLVDKLSPDMNLRPYIWPIALIGSGLFIMLRPRGYHHFKKRWDTTNALTNDTNTYDMDRASWHKAMVDGNDVVDATAIFGGVKKNITSKNFKGGDITAIMGGIDINLMQADFEGRVTIDCLSLFGGAKLIVPADWDVQSGVVAIFGGVDDKRLPPTGVKTGKVLYLDGTSLFGGIEIKSY